MSHRRAVMSPSSLCLLGLNELHKCLVLHPSCTETKGDDDYEDIMALTRLELCPKRIVVAKAHFTQKTFWLFLLS